MTWTNSIIVYISESLHVCPCPVLCPQILVKLWFDIINKTQKSLYHFILILLYTVTDLVQPHTCLLLYFSLEIIFGTHVLWQQRKTTVTDIWNQQACQWENLKMDSHYSEHSSHYQYACFHYAKEQSIPLLAMKNIYELNWLKFSGFTATTLSD